jgi:hypothetical protein
MWNPFRRKQKDTFPKPKEPQGPNEVVGADIYVGAIDDLLQQDDLFQQVDQDRLRQILDRARQKLSAARQAATGSGVSNEVRVVVGNGNDNASYFADHPPRCVVGFKTRRVELPGVVFDGHASAPPPRADVTGVQIEGRQHFNLVIQLLCTCGCGAHHALGHYWRNPDHDNVSVFVSPLALRCAECGKITELFDSDIHGYDAEIGAPPTNHRGEGERSEFACAKCGPTGLQAIARFEYSDDLFESGFEQFRGREQDVFSWFSLVGKCSGCGRLLDIADFECA